MNPFRRVLRYILGSLSRNAIRKHNLELIVITGWYGTEVARELLYTILNEKLRVRRNNKEIWWDFSIPLAVLGYKDVRRNPFQWLLLILKASVYLTFGRSNPHILILSADCTYKMTAQYWASFIKPDYLLILNYEQEADIVNELVKSTDPERGVVIYNPAKLKQLNNRLKRHKTFTYGESSNARLVVKHDQDKLKIRYNQNHVNLPVTRLPFFSADMLGGVFGVSVLKGLELTEAGFGSLKFELPPQVVSKIRTNLDFKGLQ
jgi:hypothetical protein